MGKRFRGLLLGLTLACAALTVVPASATHFQCTGYVGPFQPGVGGVQVAPDAGTPHLGACVRVLDAVGNVTVFVSVKIGLYDLDPASPGNEIAAGVCTEQAGNCNYLVQATGVEVGTVGSCNDSSTASLCVTGTKVYVANETTPAFTGAKTGISFTLGSLATFGDVIAGVGCPACVRDTKVYIGTIKLYANNTTPISVNLCAEIDVHNSIANCPPLVG
jgi:hypothetical protein